ncbi:MAG: HNH endonuclease [Gordonia sp.]|nr:HNH endonuclease [Gordonia sp. (in: high G+C Gram-positive bacteria)]
MFEPWPSLDPSITGITPAMSLRANDLLASIERALTGQGYLEWARYTYAAELHRQLEAESVASHDFLQDAYVQAVARLALANRLSQTAAESHLTCALALRDRLPKVALALKHGLVAWHHIPKIVSRTDLIEGTDHAADIDRDIAESLRGKGSWSSKAMRDMIDATIFRRDPDLIRDDRKDAKDKRGVWSDGEQNGMSSLTATLSAEHTAIIMKRLEMLAKSTCRRDPRKKAQRMSDALFAITMGREFECLCDEDDEHPCEAEIWPLVKTQQIGGVDVKIVLHAIANQSTLDGEDDEPGYLEGHGVISAEHARDLAKQDSTTVRPTGNKKRPAPEAAPEPTPEPAVPTPEPAVPTPEPAEPTPKPAEPASGSEKPASAEDSGAQATADPGEDVTDESETDESETEHDTGHEAEAETGEEPGGTAPNDGAAPHQHASREHSDAGAHGACSSSQPNRAARRAAKKAAPTTMNMPAPPKDPRFGNLDNVDWDKVTPRAFEVIPLPPVKRGNHYRPSAVLDAYLRMRDLYCMWPGCNQSAWTADLDHSTEYNHEDPAAGGHTHPTGMKALCRFHHLLKTHSDWVDDQYVDRQGRTRTVVITPEGRTYDGPAWTGDDLFPALRNIEWEDPTPAPPRRRKPDQPTRTRSRTEAKHQRRQQERNRNRLRRELLDE